MLNNLNNLDNKGAIYSGVAISIMIIISSITLFIFNPLHKIQKTNLEYKSEIKNVINMRNSYERTHNKLLENVSYEGNMEHEDIERITQIDTIKEDLEDISIKGGKGKKFNIDNKTDINIDVTTKVMEFSSENPIMKEGPMGGRKPKINVKMYLNDKLIDDFGFNVEKTTSHDNEYNFTIPSKFLYNPETDETNYGEYRLEIESQFMRVSSSINYQELKVREIKFYEEDLNSKELKSTHEMRIDKKGYKDAKLCIKRGD